jgi:molybdenum cofactor guanylyltransferase
MTQFAMGGYVLAGGRSSRMGTDKSLLQFAGRPLIAHAVAKLRGLCADVHILTSNPALAAYAPLVADLHPDCGPIGGMEAALAHSPYARNLFIPVDMPFLQQTLLRNWIAGCSTADSNAFLHIFVDGGRPQPGLCLLHQDVLPFLTESIEQGEYKLMRAFDRAAKGIAQKRGVTPDEVFRQHDTETILPPKPAQAHEAGQATLTPAQLAAQHLWFANLNTPPEFAEAEQNLDALDD